MFFGFWAELSLYYVALRQIDIAGGRRRKLKQDKFQFLSLPPLLCEILGNMFIGNRSLCT